MNISERIKLQRKLNGLTQVQLSELVGVSPMSVRRWEWGERVPSSDVVPKLASVLKTSVGYLMEGTVENEKKEDENPTMAFWGSVVDNAKHLADSGDAIEIYDVSQMLSRALSYLANKIDETVKISPVLTNVGGHHNANNLNLEVGRKV